MKNKYLYNQKNKSELIKDIQNEPFKRITCSFYRYVNINNLKKLRDELFISWNDMKILGRIYLAKEGINAQISIPENKFEFLKKDLDSRQCFKNMPFKFAFEEGISFLKLTIKIKSEIVAYKISSNDYDMNFVGKHLDYKQFNQAIEAAVSPQELESFYKVIALILQKVQEKDTVRII